MGIFELSTPSLATLLLAFMALALLPACSTTDEELTAYNLCGCPEGDFDCHETCVREVIP